MKFYNSLSGIIRLYSDINETKVSLKRLTEFEIDILEEDKISEDNKEMSARIFNGDIELKNVTFSYEQEKNIYDFNAVFKLKHCNLLLGDSGSGKSTILKLMMKYYLPESGDILYNGVNLKNINSEYLRAQVAYVSQMPYFFNVTIKENLRIANPNLSAEDLKSILKQVSMFEKIESLPDKLDTLVDEAGKNFSEGQKQRLNLARAIAKNPQVYFLDEPTSSLDYENKCIITNIVKRLSKNCTVVIVTHDEYVISKMKELQNSVIHQM